MLNGLDLFSGYGGASESLLGYVRTLAYCEIEPGAQRILVRRMRKGQIERAPIWDDVRTLQGKHVDAPIDIITGGWPCTNHSIAGDFTGLRGEESSLFFEIIRLAREFRPVFLYLENVPGVLNTGFDTCLGELSKAGFDVEWAPLSAAEMGAKHLRERIWILAYSHGNRVRHEPKHERWGGGEAISPEDCQEFLSNAYFVGSDERRAGQDLWRRIPDLVELGGSDFRWPSDIPEPAIRRGTYGPFERRAGVRAGGGGWVPQTAREAFERLIGIEPVY